MIGASLLSGVLGSIHAFSVFLEPLEMQFQASRSLVSLTYSVGLICITFMVLVGHRLYRRLPPSVICLVAGVFGAFGVMLAGYATALWHVWFGYSVLFGLANGLGYGFGLQMAGQANPGREGLAMGVVTAAYALGAIISPLLFELGLAHGGFRIAMLGLAVLLLAVCLTSAFFMRSLRYTSTSAVNAGDSRSSYVVMWLAYFGGVMAGLMVIGHAAGIAKAYAPSLSLWIAPSVVAGCNLMGSLLGGLALDRVSARWVIGGFSLITGGALILLWGAGTPLIMISLGFVGFAYGGTIAAWPSLIAKRFGETHSARVYGRVFTAWGAAGLAGPWLAGRLYDGFGDYRAALLVAAMFAGISAMIALRELRPSGFRNSVN